MKKLLLSLITLWLLALPAHALDGDCDYTPGSTTTATGFANCALEIIEAQSRGVIIASTTNSSNDITATSVNSPAISALRNGTTIAIDSPVTISGSARVNLDGLGLKNVLNRDGSATASGDMVLNTRYVLTYKLSNTSWYLEAPRVVTATPTDSGISELATSAETETGTDTGRTVTPSGLLAAIAGKQTIYVPAGAMISETTTGCAAGSVESTTNQVMEITKDCDGATQEGVQFMVGMPKNWDEGTLTFRLDWTAPSGSGDTIWLFSCLARSNDDAMDTAFGTEISVTDTVLTALDVHQTPESGAVTASGTAAENDNLWCRIQRDADAGGDTLNAVDAKILGVRVLYTANAFTDD